MFDRFHWVLLKASNRCVRLTTKLWLDVYVWPYMANKALNNAFATSFVAVHIIWHSARSERKYVIYGLIFTTGKHTHLPIPKPKINADRNQIEILLLSAFPNIIKCSKWSLACNATSWNGSFDVRSLCFFSYAFRIRLDMIVCRFLIPFG